MKIDVVICSYNEAQYFPALLDSLSTQSVSKDAFRIIFVDNGSTDDTKRIIESYHDRLNIFYVYEPKLGKSSALNTGYRMASTEYVAQTDADCKVTVQWLENISRTIDAEEPDVLGGPYFAYYNSKKPNWFKDEYNQMYLGDQKKLLDKDFLSGANTVWRRELVRELNGYDDNYSIIKDDLVGGEDTELIVRARRKHKNLKVLYDPSIVVFHLTKKKYLNVRSSIKRSWNSGLRAPGIFYTKEERQTPWFVITGRLLKASLQLLYSFSIGIIFRDKKKFQHYQNFVKEIIAPQFYILGSAFGEFQFFLHYHSDG